MSEIPREGSVAFAHCVPPPPHSHSMIVAEVVDDSCEDCEPDSVVSASLLVFDVAVALLPLALMDEKMPALPLALLPLVTVTVSATLMPALLEVLWKAAAFVWLVVFSTLASNGLTAPVLWLVA